MLFPATQHESILEKPELSRGAQYAALSFGNRLEEVGTPSLRLGGRGLTWTTPSPNPSWRA